MLEKAVIATDQTYGTLQSFRATAETSQCSTQQALQQLGNDMHMHHLGLQQIETLSNTQTALHTAHSKMLANAVRGGDEIHDSVQTLAASAETSHQSTRHALEILGDKVQDLSGISTGQVESLRDACDAIKLLTQQFSNKFCDTTSNSDPPTGRVPSEEHCVDEKAQESLDDDQNLKDAIDRLCHLAREKETSKFSEDAEEIILDVQQLFDLLLKAEAEELQDRKGKRGRGSYESDTQDDFTECQREVKRMKAILDASQCVTISEQGTFIFVCSSFGTGLLLTHPF